MRPLVVTALSLTLPELLVVRAVGRETSAKGRSGEAGSPAGARARVLLVTQVCPSLRAPSSSRAIVVVVVLLLQLPEV